MEMKTYMFLYSFMEGQVISEIIVVDIMDSTQLNFPIKSFYTHEK